MRINKTKDIPYHTQRNNTIIPHSSCNTTAMVMALLCAGWEKEVYAAAGRLGHKQPEDALTSLFDWKNQENQWWGKIPPKVNQFVGQPVCRLNWKITFNELCRILDSGGGFMIGGRFPHYKLGTIGHFAAGAGHYSGPDGRGLVIDDPYGDYRVSYNPHRSGVRGNDIDLPFDDFLKLVRGTDAGSPYKWAFTIVPNGQRSE